MVEAAELAEIFQWMRPEESQDAHQDLASKQRIGEEVADVLVYLLQVADHSEIDIAQAVKDKLARNALKYPTTRVVARVSPARAEIPGTHVLLDFENVQPTEDELQAMVPDASQVWVFHGPHQKQIEQRFASFGTKATAVPISKTGKNALDFHLSFYMGYIASQNQASAMVVVANDKGYEPILEHARAMGFAVRQIGHGRAQPASSGKGTPATKIAAKAMPVKKAAAKKAPAKKAAAKRPAVKQVQAKKAMVEKAAPAAPAAKKAVAKKAVAKKMASAKKVPAVKTPPVTGAPAATKASVATGTGERPASSLPDSEATAKKITDSLRTWDKRPTKPASLRRSLKSFLGAGTTEASVEDALARLIEDGVVKVDPVKGASYPKFDRENGSTVTQV